MKDVFDVLTADHRTVQEILDGLESPVTTREGSSSGTSGAATRQESVDRLVIEESRHEAAEEMHFWPLVRGKVPGGDALVATALEQEAEGKRMLEAIRKADPAGPEFGRLVEGFITAAREHIAFEETKVWPLLVPLIDQAMRLELGEKISNTEKAGPTLPHPHAPSRSGALKVAAPMAALLDKARDALTGRKKGR